MRAEQKRKAEQKSNGKVREKSGCLAGWLAGWLASVVTLHCSHPALVHIVLVLVFAMRAHSLWPATFVKRANRALDK